MVLVVMAGGVAPVALADTAEEIERAAAELDELQQRADALAARIETSWQRQVELEVEVVSLADAQARIEAEFVGALADLEDTAIRLYMDVAAGDGLSTVMNARGESYAAAVHYLSTVADDSEAALGRLLAVAGELDRRRAELTAALDEQAETDAELVELIAEVESALEDQAERLRTLEDLRAQEIFLATSTTTTTTTTAPTTTPPSTAAVSTTAPPTTAATTSSTSTTTTTTTAPTTTTTAPPAPVSAGGGACPVAGPVTFVDSWGAPRSGGRAHEGVDMIAARGTPIVAIHSGVIQRATASTLGGITLWLRSDAGDEYYYAHMDGYAEGITSGVRVNEGQVIGFNGSTGNAPAHLPHLHFEYHPGGGSAVNPYPLVRSLCG